MTAAFCAHWNAPTRGLVVTRYGHGLKAGETCGGVEIVEAGHPSPDASSLAAGARLLELAASARDDEYLICLISGGGSSLAAAPMPPITFEQKRAAANYLIRAGADVREINCVRKHLSRLKGGRLAAAAHPSRVITFVISDIPGDEVGDIASGPTSTGRDDASRRAARSSSATAIRTSRSSCPCLRDRTAGDAEAGRARNSRATRVHLIATASTALDAATKFLRGQGYEVIDLGDDLADEAQELGRRAREARDRAARARATRARSCPAARRASC